MKKILLNILKEIGIGLLILMILAAVLVWAFSDQLPYDEVIRSGEEYVKANIKEYSVSSSDRISEVTAVTITHEADSNQIIEAENEVRIQSGKYTPFGSISGTSDLPTEKIGVTVTTDTNNNSAANTNGNTTSSDNDTSNNKETLEYPVTDDAVKQIEEEQSESAESAANRRFNNEVE